MKILTFLNISNRKNLRADSAYIFYNILSKYFTSNNEFIIASPMALEDDKSIHIYKEFGYNKYEVRLSFCWNEIVNLINSVRPDILLINQVEQVPHYKAVIESLGLKISIASYAHYIPYVYNHSKIVPDMSLNNAGLGKAIIMSFFSGLILSDVVFTHSQTSKEMLQKLYEKFLEPFDENKFIIAPPPLDPYLKDNNENPTKKAFYNHRLYKHYGSELFIELAQIINDNFDIEMNVLDALGERSEIQRRMDPSVDLARNKLSKINNVKIINSTFERSEYKRYMKGALFSIAPFRENCIWAMSCIDSMGMGVPVIAPKIAWFKEFMPSDLCFITVEEALQIVEKLVNDKEYWMSKSQQVKGIVSNLEASQIANVFLNTFQKVKLNG